MKFSKKNKREMTPFLAKELLYDYATLAIGVERLHAIESAIQESQELQRQLAEIKNGIEYAEQLSATIVMDTLVEKITTPTTYFEVLIKNLRVESWSPLTRTVVEGVLVGLGIAALSIFIPWGRLIDLTIGEQNMLLLAQIENSQNSLSAPEQDAPEANLQIEATATYPDEPQENQKTPSAEPSPISQKAPDQPSAKVATKVVDKSPSEKREGFLYRGILRVSNLPSTTQKLVESISELGGRKAGKVELGWKRGDQTYFHFTIPESKYDSLVEVFKHYGELRISKEHHDRVMPEGIIRLIVDVEEGRAP